MSHSASAKPAVPAGHQLPPRGFSQTLKQLGPGMIVSGSIVGSGELIASTTLGATVGFAALWLVLLSCIIKVVVQEELGRYTVASGETSFEALNRVPGPRWRVSWVVWCWILMFTGVIFQQGGIVGGVAQVFNMLVPQLSVEVWVVLATVATMVLLFGGRYRQIERTCTFMVVSFTFITMVCALAMAWTPYAIRFENLAEGFRFYIPADGLAVAFAAFGITGAGATELIYYPYWCLEKGYARYVGPNDGSAGWRDRAAGWTRIMQIDTATAMVVYTLATIAFYLLGASILFGMQTVPSGYDMVRTLSSIYTETLGSWALYLFLLGAFFVLYSTIFSATASNSKVVVDFLHLSGAIHVADGRQQLYWWRWGVIVLLMLNAATFYLLGEPVLLVIIGGTAQALMLPIIGFSVLYLRYRHLDPALRPNLIIDICLWTASSLMLMFASYTVVRQVIRLVSAPA